MILSQCRVRGFEICVMTAAVSAFDLPPIFGQGEKNIPPQSGQSNQKYTTSQTLSDQAQKNAIAFDALAFLTGDACSNSFLPPGKVADYAGFQYLHDNDVTEMGHNTDFVTRASDNVLYILNNDQINQFAELSKKEKTLSEQYGYVRFTITKAFRAQLEGNIPSGSSGLDLNEVKEYSAQLYRTYEKRNLA